MAVTPGRGFLHRLAAAAPVGVFVVQGVDPGPAGDAEVLRLDPRLAIVDSPRHATVLLVAGDLPPALHGPAALVHDGLPHPRATVRWGAAADGWTAAADSIAVPTGADIGAAVVAANRSLLAGARETESPWVTTTGREEWRDVGPYGHGGSGMTGGVPFGRPLPDRGDDLRDGLKLDLLPLVTGPFLPALPTGLTLEVALQGDLVQDVEVRGNPFDGDAGTTPGGVFLRAATEAVAVTDLEHARAASHLRAVARTLRLLGLSALSHRVLRTATASAPDMARAAPALLRRLRRIRVAWSLPGAGVLGPEAAHSHGLAARAAGRAVDARTDDPAYQGLGFAPVRHESGDARARWAQRLDEVDQALRLVATAGDRLRDPGPALEHPGPVAAELLPLLPGLLIGLEWGDAVSVVDSLDLDLRRDVPAPVPAGTAG